LTRSALAPSMDASKNDQLLVILHLDNVSSLNDPIPLQFLSVQELSMVTMDSIVGSKFQRIVCPGYWRALF
jgi:hypothetical protein